MLASRLNLHVDFLSNSHRVSCRVQAGPSGLMALLNDTTSSVVEIEDGYLSRLAQPAKILTHCESGYLQKAGISLCIVTRREEVGPPGVARGGFTQVTNCPVRMTMSQFEIQGVVEVVSKFDAAEILVSGTGRFFPVYNASAWATAYPEFPFSGGVILVNRQLVMLIAPTQRSKT